ncbi:hypothetical protein IJI31_02870 [bacterium]|nr:hypothetical protein [bacterium]
MTRSEKIAVKEKNEIFWQNLYIIESLINILKDGCNNLEFNSVYYNDCKDYRFKLSEERNNCINTLSVVLEKLENIKSYHED